MPGFPIYDARNAVDFQDDSPGLPKDSEIKHDTMRFRFRTRTYGDDLYSGDNCTQDEVGSSEVLSSDLRNGRRIAELLASQITYSVHSSAESEHDLAAMVHDFLENGSCGSDFPESSDNESSLPNGPKLLESLQALKYDIASHEKELLTILTKLSLSIKEIDLVCGNPASDCKGGCIRRLLVKHLRLNGYDAAICSSSWPTNGKVAGGEYEYIDVIAESGFSNDRLIVDVDFQSQFAIARPTHSYATAMKFLPVIFAGSPVKLEKVLKSMAEAAKLSLSQNSMPLPPWRTLDYMKAKWLSSYERSFIDTSDRIRKGPGNSQWRERVRKKQCVEQLRHLKLCIAAEADKNIVSKPSSADRNRMMYLANNRRLQTGSPYFEKLKALASEKPE